MGLLYAAEAHTARWAGEEGLHSSGRIREEIGRTIAYDSEIMGDISTGGTVPAEHLGRVTAESLVLVGGSSPEWMIAVGRQVADALPNGRHRVLEGQEHVVPPEVLVPVLAGFFAD